MHKEAKLCSRCKKNTTYSELCRSCGRTTLPAYKSTYNFLCNGAKKKNIPLSLTFDDFLTFVKIEECVYCKTKIMWNKHRERITSTRYNLDRKDNSKGYTLENCVVCCKKCNYLKSDKFSFNEMTKIVNILEPKVDKFYTEREKFIMDNGLYDD